MWVASLLSPAVFVDRVLLSGHRRSERTDCLRCPIGSAHNSAWQVGAVRPGAWLSGCVASGFVRGHFATGPGNPVGGRGERLSRVSRDGGFWGRYQQLGDQLPAGTATAGGQRAHALAAAGCHDALLQRVLFTSNPVKDCPAGRRIVTVFVNGIPSTSRIIPVPRAVGCLPPVAKKLAS